MKMMLILHLQYVLSVVCVSTVYPIICCCNGPVSTRGIIKVSSKLSFYSFNLHLTSRAAEIKNYTFKADQAKKVVSKKKGQVANKQRHASQN